MFKEALARWKSKSPANKLIEIIYFGPNLRCRLDKQKEDPQNRLVMQHTHRFEIVNRIIECRSMEGREIDEQHTANLVNDWSATKTTF